MQKVARKNLYRIVDANFNRAKEGLRVCEDICRFGYNQRLPTKNYKAIRHRLTETISELNILDIIQSRDIRGDVGKRTIMQESKRNNFDEVFYANSQRIKESIRVLEEVTKLLSTQTAGRLKKMRYKVYALEKEITRKR